ncbi:MAG: hypothetical protein HYV42_01650 [Candidatus Magasanikbacteria bacterium]|nr:hypothetical protein [Candidatus Magasanikbacteria bacterium]
MQVQHQTQSGYLLIFALVFTTILMTAAAGLVGYAQINLKAEAQTIARAQALPLAEAGIERAIKRLNEDANYAGETDTPLGPGFFTVGVTSVDSYTKRLVATGRVIYGGGSVAAETIKAVVKVDSINASFTYGVQSGRGGFTMGNNSLINGSLIANGNISGAGRVTGDVTVTAGAAAEPDQGWNLSNADFNFGHTDDRTAVAQRFVPTLTNALTRVSVQLKKIGSPSNLILQIVTDNSGSPSKTVLVSGAVSAALVSPAYTWVDAALNGTLNLAAGQTYWLMLVSAVNANHYYSWAMDQNFPSGKYSAKWNAGNPVWNPSGGQFNFQTYLGGAVNTLSGITVGGTARAAVMSDCTVGGDAYFDQSNTCTVQGQQFGATPAPPPAPFPVSDAQIAAWEAAAAAGGIVAGDYVLDGQTATLGPQKIDGNLTVSNNSTLNLTGPVWVAGDLIFDNNVQIRLHPSLGNAGTAIIADYPASSTLKGKMTIGNNSGIAGNGQPGSLPLLISMYAGPGNAIDLSNNATNTIFFAPRGTITISNNTEVKEMTARQINMSNNSVVNYESGLQSVYFTTGPGGSWQFQSGSYVIE